MTKQLQKGIKEIVSTPVFAQFPYMDEAVEAEAKVIKQLLTLFKKHALKESLEAVDGVNLPKFNYKNGNPSEIEASLRNGYREAQIKIKKNLRKEFRKEVLNDKED